MTLTINNCIRANGFINKEQLLSEFNNLETVTMFIQENGYDDYEIADDGELMLIRGEQKEHTGCFMPITARWVKANTLTGGEQIFGINYDTTCEPVELQQPVAVSTNVLQQFTIDNVAFDTEQNNVIYIVPTINDEIFGGWWGNALYNKPSYIPSFFGSHICSRNGGFDNQDVDGYGVEYDEAIAIADADIVNVPDWLLVAVK